MQAPATAEIPPKPEDVAELRHHFGAVDAAEERAIHASFDAVFRPALERHLLANDVDHLVALVTDLVGPDGPSEVERLLSQRAWPAWAAYAERHGLGTGAVRTPEQAARRADLGL